MELGRCNSVANLTAVSEYTVSIPGICNRSELNISYNPGSSQAAAALDDIAQVNFDLSSQLSTEGYVSTPRIDPTFSRARRGEQEAATHSRDASPFQQLSTVIVRAKPPINPESPTLTLRWLPEIARCLSAISSKSHNRHLSIHQLHQNQFIMPRRRRRGRANASQPFPPASSRAELEPRRTVLSPEDALAIRRRREAAALRLERLRFGFPDDAESDTPMRSSGGRIDGYLDFLFTRLDEAGNDMAVDFDWIVGLIRTRMAGFTAREPVALTGDLNSADAGRLDSENPSRRLIGDPVAPNEASGGESPAESMSHLHRSPSPSPSYLSPGALRNLAEDASVLLELYSKLRDSTSTDADVLISSAYTSVATLHRHHRVRARGQQSEDSVCIICCGGDADTLLVPCHHLVLCSVRG